MNYCASEPLSLSRSLRLYVRVCSALEVDRPYFTLPYPRRLSIASAQQLQWTAVQWACLISRPVAVWIRALQPPLLPPGQLGRRSLVRPFARPSARLQLTVGAVVVVVQLFLLFSHRKSWAQLWRRRRQMAPALAERRFIPATVLC